MILRKPFKILITHFRLIHFILMALMLFVIYNTNLINSFLREYLRSTSILITHESYLTMFNSYFNIAIIFVLILTT